MKEYAVPLDILIQCPKGVDINKFRGIYAENEIIRMAAGMDKEEAEKTMQKDVDGKYIPNEDQVKKFISYIKEEDNKKKSSNKQ